MIIGEGFRSRVERVTGASKESRLRGIRRRRKKEISRQRRATYSHAPGNVLMQASFQK